MSRLNALATSTHASPIHQHEPVRSSESSQVVEDSLREGNSATELARYRRSTSCSARSRLRNKTSLCQTLTLIRLLTLAMACDSLVGSHQGPTSRSTSEVLCRITTSALLHHLKSQHVSLSRRCSKHRASSVTPAFETLSDPTSKNSVHDGQYLSRLVVLVLQIPSCGCDRRSTGADR